MWWNRVYLIGLVIGTMLFLVACDTTMNDLGVVTDGQIATARKRFG